MLVTGVVEIELLDVMVGVSEDVSVVVSTGRVVF
jgi:hypothetical protein